MKRRYLKTGFFVSRFLILVVPGTLVSQFKRIDHFSNTNHPSVHVPFASKGDTLINNEGTDSSITSASTEKITIPTVHTSHYVSKLVKDYLKRESESLAEIKDRSDFYFSIIGKVFDKYHLPDELKYLAVVESNLKSKVTSRLGAKGIWQLMPETARDYGLKVSHKYDERTNLYKSTVAAAKYLRSLYAEFDDWLLVIAAYNGGTGTVRKAIRKSGSRNYWSLRNFLPAETKAHVKHYIATHYFFEGQGGITTLTKSERIAYLNEVKKFKETQNRDSLIANVSKRVDSSSKQNQPDTLSPPVAFINFY